MAPVYGPDGTEPAAKAFSAVLASIADQPTKDAIRTFLQGELVQSTDGQIEVAWIGVNEGVATISIRNPRRAKKIVYWMVIQAPDGTPYTSNVLDTIRVINSPTAATWQLPECLVLSVLPRFS